MSSSDPDHVDVLAVVERTQHEVLPNVSPESGELLRRAALVTRYVPEGHRAELVAGLHEIADRDQKNPGELGDLGPDAPRCGRLAHAIEHTHKRIARLKALLAEAEAERVLLESAGARAVDQGYEQATVRIERGRLPPDSYGHVVRFGNAHGESVVQGRQRAQRVRAEKVKASPVAPDAAPANDVNAAGKTGTHDR